MKANRAVSILLVEDDEVDVMLFRRAMKEGKIANPLTIASDGIEALRILRGEPGAPRVEEPRIVLLDLNMPRMNGIEFLEAIRADDELRRTLVFVFTTSRADADRFRAYDLNVAGYIVKSELPKRLLSTLMMLEQFWTIVVLPQR